MDFTREWRILSRRAIQSSILVGYNRIAFASVWIERRKYKRRENLGGSLRYQSKRYMVVQIIVVAVKLECLIIF